jgi:hypothetical protein
MNVTPAQAQAQVNLWSRACKLAIRLALSGDKRASTAAYQNARAAARAAFILFPDLNR